MKKTFFLSFFLLVISGVTYAQNPVHIVNNTDCDVKIHFDCYDLCIYYNAVDIVVPKNSSQLFYGCATYAGINDLVATITDGCSNSAQIDCVAGSGGCGVGTTSATLPACPSCGQTSQYNVIFTSTPFNPQYSGTLQIN